MLRLFGIFVLVILAGALLIQLAPYGRDHTNPPVVTQIRWDGPQTEQLARAACFDCHSNETRWPWYTHVAPVSWIIYNHVSEGRRHLNLSDLLGSEVEPEEIGESIREDSMPPADYRLMHPEARLSDAQKQQLIQGLSRALSGYGSGEHDE